MSCNSIGYCDSGNYSDLNLGSELNEKGVEKNSIITNIAINSLIELTASLAMVGVTIPFVATGAGALTILAAAGTTFCGNTALRCIQGHEQSCRLEEAKSKGEEFVEQEQLKLKREEEGYSLQRAFIFSFLDNATRDVLVHEMGHAITAQALFKTRAAIEIFPLRGGVTQFSPAPLTNLGKYFGARHSNMLIAGAGAAAALLFVLVNLSAAHFLEKEHQEASLYLMMMAIMSIVNHTVYALSALLPSKLIGHDFIMLAKFGIHPLFAAAFILLVPAVFELGVISIKKIYE